MINNSDNIVMWLSILSLATWIIFHMLVWRTAWLKAQNGSFYSDTPYLHLLGIFVWGDALILGPFWILSSLVFLFMPGLMVVRYLLVFYCLRSCFEVIYWLNHQAVKSSYVPPLFRRWKWIGSNEAAILYQLINMCQTVICLSLLLWSFWW